MVGVVIYGTEGSERGRILYLLLYLWEKVNKKICESIDFSELASFS